MFSQTLQTMITSIQTGLQTIGKKINDYTSASAIGNILAAIASAVDENNYAITTAQAQAYLTTATDVNLDNKAADYSIIRKQATFAQWTFAFTKQTAATQQITIPAGSVVTTVPSPGQNPITFATNAIAIFPIGATTFNVPVTCQQAGSIGNIATGTQLLLGSAIPGIDGVQFTDASTGTAGIDTETDSQLRTRALNSFKGLALGTEAWYKAQALTIAGVASASVINNYLSPNGVGVYITGPNNTLPSAPLLTQVQTLLTSSRPQIDNPVALSPSQLSVAVGITISLIAGNDQATAIANVQNAISNYINGLGLGAQATSGNIYPSQMVTAALGQPGIADAGSVSLNGGGSAVAVSSAQLPAAGAVTVTVINV